MPAMRKTGLTRLSIVRACGPLGSSVSSGALSAQADRASRIGATSHATAGRSGRRRDGVHQPSASVVVVLARSVPAGTCGRIPVSLAGSSPAGRSSAGGFLGVVGRVVLAVLGVVALDGPLAPGGGDHADGDDADRDEDERAGDDVGGELRPVAITTPMIEDQGPEGRGGPHGAELGGGEEHPGEGDHGRCRR